VASALLNRLQAYTAAGELRWTTTVKRFREVTITQELSGRVVYTAGEDGRHHIILGVTALGNGLAAVQIGVLGPGATAHDDVVDVETRYFTTADGREIEGDALPAILVSAQHHQYLAIWNHPFPVLRAYERAP
jgi:hypothetical protein